MPLGTCDENPGIKCVSVLENTSMYNVCVYISIIYIYIQYIYFYTHTNTCIQYPFT